MVTLHNVIDTRTGKHYSIAIITVQHAKWFVELDGSPVTIPDIEPGNGGGSAPVDNSAEILSIILGGSL